MEENLKVLTEGFTTLAKFGKFFYKYTAIPHPLAAFKEGGDNTVEGKYCFAFWYEDSRGEYKPQINRIYLEWSGKLDEETKSRFLKQCYTQVLQTMIFVKNTGETIVNPIYGTIHIYIDTQTLLTEGFVYNKNKD